MSWIHLRKHVLKSVFGQWVGRGGGSLPDVLRWHWFGSVLYGALSVLGLDQCYLGSRMIRYGCMVLVRIHDNEQQINVGKIERDRHTDICASILDLRPRGLGDERIHYNKLDLQSLRISCPHCTINFIDLSSRSRLYHWNLCLEVEEAFPLKLRQKSTRRSYEGSLKSLVLCFLSLTFPSFMSHHPPFCPLLSFPYDS